MNIKKITTRVCLVLSLISGSMYAMEEKSEGAHWQVLQNLGLSILQKHNNIIDAYKAIYNVIRNRDELFNNKSVHEWLFNALYTQFISPEYISTPAPAPDEAMNEKIYDALGLIDSSDQMNKDLALVHFLKWMKFKSVDDLMNFLTEQRKVNHTNYQKMGLLKGLEHSIIAYPGVVERIIPGAQEQLLHHYVTDTHNTQNMRDLIIALNEQNTLASVINSPDQNGNTLLHKAILHNNQKIVNLLLDLGADVNVANSQGMTPLHMVAMHGNPDIAKLLIMKRALLDIPDKKGETPLQKAINMDRQEMVAFLNSMSTGAAKHEETASIDDSLFYKIIKQLVTSKDKEENEKALKQWLSIVVSIPEGQILTAMKEQPYLLYDILSTPLLASLKDDNREKVSLLVKFINYLKNEGIFNISINNFYDGTDADRPLLHSVVIQNKKEMTNLLIDEGLNIDRHDADGNTPLHIAVSSDVDEDMVNLLLARGADINSTNEDGNTPLHLAAEAADKDMVEILLKNGADCTIKNNDDQTAAQVSADSDVKKTINECKKTQNTGKEEVD